MPRPKPFFKASFRCDQGKIVFDDKENRKRLQMFLEFYDLQPGEVYIEVYSEVAHFRHKYYRGVLLPAVTEKMGFKNTDYVHHIILKPRFLMEYVSGFEEIPGRVKNRARFVFTEEHDEETGEIIYVPGTDIPRQKIIAYIPSTGDISDERMRQYMQDVEAFFYEELDGGFDEELNETIIALRSKCQL